MPILLTTVAEEVRPHSTVLLFGAGASLPSGGPSVARLLQALEKEFRTPPDGFSLAEFSELCEQKGNRRRVVETIRKEFSGLRPTGGMLNLPRYDWKNLYTTNYDEVIEESYNKYKKEISVYSSDFDFSKESSPSSVKLFKIHGTISEDISTGHSSRMILTGGDYERCYEYREHIFNRLKSDLAGAHLIIIGHSLGDPDIKEIVSRAISINSKTQVGGRITLLMYEKDENRAALMELRGVRVAFGGVDEFFAAMSKTAPEYALAHQDATDPLDIAAALRPVTIDVAHAASTDSANVSAMFNGWPATYSDIVSRLTFERTVSEEIYTYLRAAPENVCATLLGASGVGKTTAARQAVHALRQQGMLCWEHRPDNLLLENEWLRVAQWLSNKGQCGVLLVDEAHAHLSQINGLIDKLASQKIGALKIICVSTRNSWRPRVKTPNIFKIGHEFRLSSLGQNEIERLIALVDQNSTIRSLVENSFAGFSIHEKRRRLIDRCESDMFVCLKNIFSSEKFDDIILREYASLSPQLQDIYRLVAAMENAGVRVHRQLVVRLLGIPAMDIEAALTHLTDIITEYDINTREGVYGWRGRHPVITGIISKYKFNDADKLRDLFEKIIDEVSPTYDVEIRSMRELCTSQYGISRIPDRQMQNRLLRRMMSSLPGERVPRHRLIRNLVEMGEFDQAQTEIRIFEKDFGVDGPVTRYRIDLTCARATKSPGIMSEDRIAILEEARELGARAVRRYSSNVQILSANCEVGIEIYKLTGNFDAFDEAIREFRNAEAKVGDPEIGRVAARYERRVAAHATHTERETQPAAVP